MKQRSRILVVMGEGGHATQCLRLVDLMGTDDYRYTYALETVDRLTESQIRAAGPVYRVTRPSCVCERRLPLDALKLVWCTLQALVIMLRVRPDAVVSVGPAVAVPFALIARILRKKVIYLESASRTQSLSLTGKLMGYLANLYFVQWEELLAVAPPHAIFAGRLF